MWRNKYYIILILVLLWTSAAYSQEHRSEILVDFRVNSTAIDPSYEQNASRLNEIEELLNSVLKDTVNIKSIYFCGTASPEGSYQVNRRLAKGRMDALEKVVRSRVDIPEALIMRDDMYIPWEYLADLVSGSDMAYKNEVLEILHGEHKIVPYNGRQQIDSRIPALKKLDNGKVWNDLNLRFFRRMRNASVVFVTYKPIRPEPEPIPEPEPVVEEVVEVIEPEPEPEPVVEPEPEPEPEPVVEEWNRKWYVKTNALGWGLAIANAAVEFDLCHHWSINIPIYYSAWNYFRSTVKFRTAMIQPEVRYWFRDNNDGWYAGAHVGVGHYNIATNGTYRTQDHKGKSPAWGGGLAVGYRLPISRDNRWKVEFSLGAGVYGLNHDKHRNQHNGLLVYTEKKTYFGIDQAAVSFSYTFDLKKKGGAR